MLKLLSLKFKNIRCFDTEQTINFEERSKLIQVDGINNNTGGSSGSGKTSALMALDYLLGINDIPSTALQCRLTKEPIEVTGEFKSDEKLLIITRGKKNGLTINYGGEIISGNVKIAEEKLDEIIGIPRKIFRKMIHKKQKEGGFFLDMTAKETYEFLVKMLNLDDYITKTDTIAANIKEYEERLATISLEFSIEKEGIEALEQIKSKQEKPVQTVTIEEVHHLEQTLDVLKEKLAVIVSVNTELLFDDTPLLKLNEKINDLQIKETQADVAKQKLEGDLSKINDLEFKAKEIVSTMTRLKKQSGHFMDQKCPTCEREWVGDAIQKKIRENEEEIAGLTDRILSYKMVLSGKNEVAEKYERTKDIIEIVREQINNLRSEVSQEEIKKIEFYSKANEGNLKEISLKKDLMYKIELEYTSKKEKLSSFFDQSERYEKELMEFDKIIGVKKESILNIEKEQLELKDKLLVASEAKRLVKSYVLQTFQETLDLIGDTASSILASIPNMANSTIYFEGCKENKDGSLKDEVNAILNIEGDPNIPIKTLSGGERTAIDLAIDLSVIDIIETKAGKGADFYIIDEPFDGLDAVCKENCLELLKQLDTNKKIIMVDHSSEVKEMVSDIIMVTKTGLSSIIS